MKHLIRGYIVCKKSPWDTVAEYSFQTFDVHPEYQGDTVVVREHSFEVDVPDDFDPRPGMIEQLREKEAKARADFQKTITDIHRQISELQAIEHSPA